MTTQPTATSRKRRGRNQSPRWPVPAGLTALAFVPLTAGTLRLIELSGGPAVMPSEDRFTGLPTALVVHTTGATVLALLGIAQFVPGIRRPAHRRQDRSPRSAKTAPEGALP
jgi:hypothetical protein